MSNLIAGCDEAGRGPLAGPVVAAAVIFPNLANPEIKDSKKLTASKRESLYHYITTNALSWAVGIVEAEEIDRINILQATLKAFAQAVNKLSIRPHLVLIDGNRAPQLDIATKTIVQGDKLEPIISAASIIAKVTRDRIMHKLEQEYPGYGLSINMGYPTSKHLAALNILGASKIHRQSFAPVRNLVTS